jgi:RND superfamily putative drug exporter
VLPFAGVRYAEPTATSLPESSASRQLADLAATRFAAPADVDAVTVVAVGSVGPDALGPYVEILRALPGAQDVSVREVPGLTVVDVLPVGESQGAEAMELVRTVRATPAPAQVLVTGDAAQLSDYKASLAHRLPWALAIVLLSTFILLFLFTGSVVIPLKAIAMNVLSLGASLGALVWVFQEGHLAGLVGSEALGSLSVTTPVLVAAIAFGLSMDYEVFLLGRIAEAYRATGDNGGAIDRGLQRTGGIVTAAALLMGIVFAGFVAGGFSPVKQVGLGLVVAIAVDATLVRMLLVPAVMQLMGRANWWAPSALRRLHARVGLHDEPAASAVTPTERRPVPQLLG